MNKFIVITFIVFLSCTMLTSCMSSNGDSYEDAFAVAGGPVTFAPISFAGVISGKAISHDKVQLLLNPAIGGSGNFVYRVYVNGQFSAPFLSTSALSSNQNSESYLIVDGLKIANLYSFIIKVYDSSQSIEDGNLVSVNVATLTTFVPDFDGVSLLSNPAGSTGETEITVNWNAATAVSNPVGGYKIYLKEQSGTFNFFSPALVVGDNTTAVNVTGLTAGTTYDIVVRAFDSLGNEEKNEKIMSSTTSTGGPIVFSGIDTVSIPFDVSGYTEAHLSWPVGQGSFNQYRVYYSTTDITGFDPTATVANETVTDLTLNSIQVTGLLSQTQYFVAVVAYNSSSNAHLGSSKVQSFTTSPAPPSFNGVASAILPAGVDGLTQVKLTWNAASGPFNRYEVYKREASGAYPGAPEKIEGPTTIESLVIGLTTDTTYCFKVKAVFFDGAANINTDTNAIERCQTPTLTLPTFNGVATCTVIDHSQIQINWPAANGIYDKYKIYYSDTGVINFAGAEDFQVAPSMTGVTVTGLDVDKTYTFGVRSLYTGTGAQDTNTVTVNCDTDVVFPIFTQIFSGIRSASNIMLGATQLCIQDSAGQTITNFNDTASLTLVVDGVNFNGGATSDVAFSSGCSSWTNLVYAGGNNTIQLRATGANFSQTDSGVINVVDDASPATCSVTDANWVDGFGGCYLVPTGQVFTAPLDFKPGVDSVIWKPDSLEYELTDFDRSGNGTGVNPANDGDLDGEPDEFDPTSAFFQVLDGTANSCHDLESNGYNDWRLPTITELLGMNGLDPRGNLAAGFAAYFYSTTDSNATSIIAEALYVVTGAITTTLTTSHSSMRLVCVRDAELVFTSPSFPGNVGITGATKKAGPAGTNAVDLTWNTATGTFSGYQIYWAEDTTGGVDINYNVTCALPVAAAHSCAGGTCCRQFRKNITSGTISGLIPSTTVEFSVKAAWTNKVNPILDSNLVVLTETLDPAELKITHYNGETLSTGEIPVFVKSVDPETQDVIAIDGEVVTLNKVSGGGILTNVTATLSNGVAKFTNLTYSMNDTLQINASSPNFTSSSNSSATILVPKAAACTGFTEDLYPANGGCYFKSLDLVIADYEATNQSVTNSLWESGVGPGFAGKEASDILDGDGDGQFDEFATGAGCFVGAITVINSGHCHSLVEGGFDNWHVPTRVELNAIYNAGLNSLLPIADANYFFSSCMASATTTNRLHLLTGTWSITSAGGAIMCVRTP